MYTLKYDMYLMYTLYTSTHKNKLKRGCQKVVISLFVYSIILRNTGIL